jgi:hypothetical protein
MRALFAILIACSALMISCAPREASPDRAGETAVRDGAESVAKTDFILPPEDPTEGLEEGDPEIGRDYFYGENRGRCLRCHRLHGEGEPTGWALDDAGLRRDAEWLATFLHNPRGLRPEVARMPPYRGDPKARLADVVAFLMSLRTPVEHPEPSDVKPADEPEKWESGVGD